MMETVYAESKLLAGSPYDIGCALGRQMANQPQLVDRQHYEQGRFTKQQISEMLLLFDVWCPGLNEELRGFSDTLGIAREELVYCHMTYLIAGCSQLGVLPSSSEDGHGYLARNTDFSHHFEDFTLCKTMVTGKYAHIGTSVALLGRGEGINACGLAISQTSCGIPVGKGIAGLQAPAITGLQYWAVIRTLLENCRDIEEALQLLNEMPIAYNLNLMLVDSTETVVLFETLDGKKAHRMLNKESKHQYLHATNHAVLPELAAPYVMQHSAVRYDRITAYLNGKDHIRLEDIKTLLLQRYPEGLCCPWYDDFMGTTKSIIFDVTNRSVHLCWGGLAENGWKTYSFDCAFPEESNEIIIRAEVPDPNVFSWKQLRG